MGAPRKETGLPERTIRSQHQALTWGLPSSHRVETARPGPTQQAGSPGLGRALASRELDGAVGLSYPTPSTLPTSQPEPSLDFMDRNSGPPARPPCTGWKLGRVGAFGMGAGAGPRNPLRTLQRRLREGPLPHNKAQMTFVWEARASLGRSGQPN